MRFTLKSLPRFVRTALGLAGGFAIALLLAEIALRIAAVKYDASFYGTDTITGWRLRPGAHGWWISEAESYVTINSAGMHDREYPAAKPADVVRIAVLGDSMTAALQVDVERNFTRVLEDRLNACGAFPGKRVEVMNFGVPGFGTAQELLTFRHRVVPFQVDGVILAFYTYNDIQNNVRSLNPVDSSKSPYFLLENGTLVLDDAFKQNSGQLYGKLRDRFGDMANSSRVLQLVSEVVIRRGILARQKKQESSQIVQEFGKGADNLIYKPPVDPAMKEAWAVSEALILQMDREVREQGMKFWFVTLSQSPQDLPPARRDAEMKRIGIDDVFYPDRRLAAFTREHGIDTLTLAPIMADWSAQSQQLVAFGTGVGHYNQAGHRVAGEAMARQLCSGQ